MNIIAILKSNLTEREKQELFDEWLSEQLTPKPIKELLNNADIATKLAATIQSDSLVKQVIFDILTKYGTLEYPKR